MGNSQTEPAKQVGVQNAIIGLIVAGSIFAASVGLDISDETRNALIGLVGAFAVAWPYLTAIRIRGRVFSPASAQEIADGAHHAGETGQPVPKVQV